MLKGLPKFLQVSSVVAVALFFFGASNSCSKKDKELETPPPTSTPVATPEAQPNETPAAPTASLAHSELHGKVVQVVQADTLKILSGKKKMVVRLFGVHAPAGNSAILARGKKLAEKLVLGKQVNVDVKGKDHMGRDLAIVILPPGTNLNHELVRDGDVIWDPKSGKDAVAQELQDQAKLAKKGLWAKHTKTSKKK